MRPNVQVNVADVSRRLGVAPEAHWETCAITGISQDNRTIHAGDLFVAVPGTRIHGANFADAAVAAGAVAVLTDPAGRVLVNADVPCVVVEDVAQAAGEAAAAVMGDPAKRLTTYAVTGTNGKTTTAFMVERILDALGRTNGLIGTVALRIAGEDIPAVLTTPQPTDLHRILRTLVDRGGTDLVMEASSHALVQGRTNPIRFDVAGFSNLTQDHLDYHETLEEYYQAKKILFSPGKSAACVVTVDDAAGRRLYRELSDRPAVTALAVFSERGTAAGWQVSDVELGVAGSRFTMSLTTPEATGELRLRVGLPGGFNVANAALAIAMVHAAGIPLEEIDQALAGELTPVVPGRMEIVGTSPRVVVDFAHNTEALEKAISTLRPTTGGKLIVLTGSAGDRDKGKRPKMAEIAARLGDLLIVTDDDPHSEDPARIRQDLIAGIPAGAKWVEIGDREEAIRFAVANAAPEDTVLLAGRGHETIQDVAGVPVELDDRVVARDELAKREANSASATFKRTRNDFNQTF